jgi:replication factor C small subunit
MEAVSDNNLFVEKYKPKTISDILGNEELHAKFMNYSETGEINNLLFAGVQGIGKTLTAKLLSESITDDVLYVNASNENGIDTIRTKIVSFCERSSFGEGKYKVIILDEADYLTLNGQAALRAIIEEHIDHTRFIFTCNFIEKILAAIKSRCEVVIFKEMDKKAMLKRCTDILKAEKITVTKDIAKIVATVIKSKYPDFRSVLNTIQGLLSEDEGKRTLNPYTSDVEDKGAILELLRAGDWTALREKIKELGYVYDDIYRYLYEHAEDISKSNHLPLRMLVRQYWFESTQFPDPEINLATLFADIIQENYIDG